MSSDIHCIDTGCMYVSVLTYEARRRRIGLDILLSVALNHIPESPHIAGVKDIEGLARMALAVLHIRTKQVVVWTGIPLMKKESFHKFHSFPLWSRNVFYTASNGKKKTIC